MANATVTRDQIAAQVAAIRLQCDALLKAVRDQDNAVANSQCSPLSPLTPSYTAVTTANTAIIAATTAITTAISAL